MSEATAKSGEVPTGTTEKRPPWAFRVKIPAWIGLLLIVVTALFSWFIAGPSRAVTRATDNTFRDTQQVVINFCLSNQQAQEPERIRAMNDLRAHLRSLGVVDPQINFTSPCPAQGFPPAEPPR